MSDSITVTDGHVYIANLSDFDIQYAYSNVENDDFVTDVLANEEKHTLKMREVHPIDHSAKRISIYSLSNALVESLKQPLTRSVVCVTNSAICFPDAFNSGSVLNASVLLESKPLAFSGLIRPLNAKNKFQHAVLLEYIEPILERNLVFVKIAEFNKTSRDPIDGITCFGSVIYSMHKHENNIQAFDFSQKKLLQFPDLKFNANGIDLAFSKDGKTLFIAEVDGSLIRTFKAVDGRLVPDNDPFIKLDQSWILGGITVSQNDELVVIKSRKVPTNQSDDNNLQIYSASKEVPWTISIQQSPKYVTEITKGKFKECFAITHVEPLNCVCIYRKTPTPTLVKTIKETYIMSTPRTIIWIDRLQYLFVMDQSSKKIVSIQFNEEGDERMNLIELPKDVHSPYHICSDADGRNLFVGELSVNGKVHWFKILESIKEYYNLI